MKKSELKNLKQLVATPLMMKLAANDTLKRRKNCWCSYEKGYQYGLYMRCRVIGNILKVAIFLPEYMKAGGKLSAYEVFIDKLNQDFITYNNLENKWQKAKLDMIDWPRYVHYSEEKWISDKDNEILKNYLQSERGGYRGLLEFQLAVRADELKQRYKKETEPWDLDMEQVKKVPKDWEKWVGKVGIDEHYIFYQYSRKGADTGYCTYCEKDVPIHEPRHNKEGICSCCHNKVVFKSEGKAGIVKTAEHDIYLLQRCEDGLVIRAFKGYRKYRKDNYRNPEQFCYEKKRTICSKGGVTLRSYYYGDYKRIETRWIPSDKYSYSWYNFGYYCYRPHFSKGRIYPYTLPGLAKKELCYTGLSEYIRKVKYADPESYLNARELVPQIEQIVKAGLFSLARDCICKPEGFAKKMKYHAGELAKMLGIDGQRLNRLREKDGNSDYLKWLQYEKKYNVILPDEVIAWLCQENISMDSLKFITGKMSMVQIYHYVRRQMEENHTNSKTIITTWSDYLSMAQRLNMDTNDAIIYRVRELFKRHGELVERCRQKDLESQAEAILKKYPHIEEIYKTVQDTYRYIQDDYTVIVPSKVEDILTEGKNLHHCVGSIDKYWDRIEQQETYVVFLRKTSEVDKSYYTLEIEPDGTVRQKRTMYDRQEADIDDAVKFLKKWQKEISKRITDKERNLAKRSRVLRIEEFSQLKKDRITINTGHLQGQLLADVLMADLMENNEEVAEVVAAA